MKRIGMICLAILLFSGISAGGKTIKLEKSFFKGWQYSVDGSKFIKVGTSGKRLISEMEGNSSAVGQMRNYRSDKIFSTMIGVAGGVLIVWPIGAGVSSGWEEAYDPVIGAGIAMVVISYILNATATLHLERAVRIFNGEEPGLKVEINCLRNHPVKSSKAQAVLSWRF